ncbi:MAG: hypothetical protein VX435_15230 [Planctomycetota bacterium]|nr:hypothetical protein [Planctomycetota bacterium]
MRCSSFLPPSKSNRPVFGSRICDWVQATPPLNYLEPHIKGGGRRAKASERALRARGIIASNKFIAPKDVSLNRAGNVTKGTMTRILSGLSALEGAARGSKSRQSKSYFAMRLGGKGSEFAIFERSGKNLKKLFKITKPQQYRKRFYFNQVSTDAVNKHFQKNFTKALSDALRTAR